MQSAIFPLPPPLLTFPIFELDNEIYPRNSVARKRRHFFLPRSGNYIQDSLKLDDAKAPIPLAQGDVKSG